MSDSDVLRTDRLALHPLSMSDHGALLAHWTGPLVRRYLFDDKTLSALEVTEIIAASQRDFATEGYGLWAVRAAARGDAIDAALPDRALVGVAGLRGHDADVEIVYSLEPDRWGQGLAAEASRAVLDYAFEVLQLRRVTAEIDEANGASSELAERLGMRPHGDPGHYKAERISWHGSRHSIDA
ncbi:GNAT family N-acetyltransferase [Spirillospora sp. NPDC048911]|uniref:GNAT family N-acetyltransferase n=1 Tax=Spirillospora sp. NPDC048911 TaxID=3364527 RepID=UPI003713FE87